ncbi:MAG: hypothetical protein L0177_18290, partial [Chloroflexi bacterium]|nr:hypothetical protein [Chloroflexota bacterium]
TGEQANLAPWLGMNPVQGSVTDGSQTLTLLASAAGLAEGTHRTSFFVTSAGATNDCQRIAVDLTVLPPAGRAQQNSVNLQPSEEQALARIIGQFLEGQKASVTDQAQVRWFEIGQTLAGSLESDGVVRRPLSDPGRNIEFAASTLASVSSVMGRWGPGSAVPAPLGEGALEFIASMSGVLSGGQAWQTLGVARVDSAGTDSLYVAYDRAEGRLLVHLDVFNPAAPGQIDAVIPVSVGEDGVSLTLGSIEGSAVLVRRVPMVMVNLQSPGELRVFDQLGRVTGVISRETIEKIPSSVFAGETASILLASDAEARRLRYEITGTEEGLYGLQVTLVSTTGRVSQFPRAGVAITGQEVHQYAIDWPRLSMARNTGWVVRVDTDGDGVFETEFPPQVPQGRPVWPIVLVATLGGIVVIGLVIWALYVLFQPARRILTKIWGPFKRFAAKIGLRLPRLPKLPDLRFPWQ